MNKKKETKNVYRITPIQSSYEKSKQPEQTNSQPQHKTNHYHITNNLKNNIHKNISNLSTNLFYKQEHKNKNNQQKYFSFLENENTSNSKIKTSRRYQFKEENEERNTHRSYSVNKRNITNDTWNFNRKSLGLNKRNTNRLQQNNSCQKVQPNNSAIDNISLREDEILETDFNTAKELYKKGKFRQALEIAKVCLENTPTNKEYQYYTAMIYLNIQEYSLGLELLEKICKENPSYKKSSFLFAAISAKNLQLYDKSLTLCSTGLEKYPKDLSLLEYRAGVFMSLNKFLEAHLDYEEIIKKNGNNVEILIKNAECLKKTGAFGNCAANLSAAMYIDKGEYKKEILIKKLDLNLCPKSLNLPESKKDLYKLEEEYSQTSEINYYKGLILKYEGYKKESILAFEKCLKENQNKSVMNLSLIEITKSKISEKDFYSAFYHIKRSKYFELQSEDIEIYWLFSEAVVHLMKKKISEADKNFSLLLPKFHSFTSDLKEIFHLYRAYAKYSLSEYQEAIQSYNLANEEAPLDIFSKYNRQLAQGIIEISNKNFDKGIEQFNMAEKTICVLHNSKIDSYLYRAGAHLQKVKELIHQKEPKEDELKYLEETFAALKELDKACDINDSNSNVLYYRALVYLYLGKFEEALQDIMKAISKSEENIAKYFFFRGVTHSSIGNKKQALNDFNICNNLDDKFYLAYFERAKLYFAHENVNRGLEDLAKLKELQNENEMDVKFHETCLNHFNGHYLMANVCSEQIKETNELTNTEKDKIKLIKIMIKLKLSKFEEVKSLMNSQSDIMIVEIIQGMQVNDIHSPNHLEIFSNYHYHHYLGVKYFKEKNYSKALSEFTMANKERSLYELELGISNNLNKIEESDEDSDDDSNEHNKSESTIDTETLHRINYNIFLCHLKLNEWKKAYETFIRDVVSIKEDLLKNEFIGTLTHLLFQSLKENPQSSLESKSIATSQSEKEIYQLNIYHSIFDKNSYEFIIELPNFIMKTKLCLIGLSNHKLQQEYSPKANPEFILNFIKMSEIENKPEPPWVKREESGLVFTAEIQNINIEFQTTENNEEEGEGEDEQEAEVDDDDDGDEGQIDDDESSAREGDTRQGSRFSGKKTISVRRFKEKMKLGDSIEKKLQKLLGTK